MYLISQLTGAIRLNDVNIPLDDSNPLFIQYLQDMSNGVQVQYVDYFEDEKRETTYEIALNNEKLKYIQRIKDGQEKYAELSAEFRIAKLSGQITEETHSAKEEILIPVRSEILAGQWVSALTKLEGIGSVLIGESLYNRLHKFIQDYVNLSYTKEEINANRIKNDTEQI